MGNQQVSEQQGHSVNFLLAEHKYLGDCFWRNEEIGERRVNFFITLVTAAITALVALATSKEGNLRKDDVYFITVLALLALLSFGVVTLLRMIHRNTVTDGYKRAMEMIRGHFRDSDDRLQGYQPFEKGKPRKLGTGGLVDMVAIVNSIIVASLCVLLAYFQPGLGIVLSGLVGFITALIVQFVYVRHRYKRKANGG
jgi:hypothetical protein